MARACIALSVVVLIAMASLAAMGGETQISDVKELAGTWRIAGQHLAARAGSQRSIDAIGRVSR
jgi:hypothetical protein